MTKNELIEQYKKEFPKLTGQVNNEVFDLSAEEYEETINRWAENRLKQLEEIAAENQKVAAKAALLEKLGISSDEAALLLS
jgi:proline dehydrogenase